MYIYIYIYISVFFCECVGYLIYLYVCYSYSRYVCKYVKTKSDLDYVKS